MSAPGVWLRAYGNACLQLLREPVASLFNLVALACASGLALAAVVWLGETSLGIGDTEGRNLSPQVTLVLRGNVTEASREALEKTLRSAPGVRDVRFIGRDAALRRLAKDLGDDRLLDGLGKNPLPDALVVTLASGLSEARTNALVTGWRSRVEVEEVLADRELTERLQRIAGTARLLAQAIVALLLVSGAVVVFNTIRLQLAGRQQEIELIRLLGAPAAFVRRPFVARGTLLAFTGAALGWGLAEIMVHLVHGWIGPLTAAWTLPPPPAAVPLPTGLGALLVALLLGWLTAWLGVARHLSATDRR
ncbi:MAG: hypothetical protein RIS59_978 [Pseudomonadota bacterium]|jgi:cell division transport system permease protein